MHIRINLVILTWSNTVPSNCFKSIIYVVQGFHKLEINSFSSTSFSNTYLWENIWSLIWTFLWTSTSQGCLNCLLAVSFVFTKIYFSITGSVLTAHCWVQKSRYTEMLTGCQFCFSSTWSYLFLSFFLLLIGNYCEIFSTRPSTETDPYRANMSIHTRILGKDFLVMEPWKDVECNYEKYQKQSLFLVKLRDSNLRIPEAVVRDPIVVLNSCIELNVDTLGASNSASINTSRPAN